MAVLHCFSKEQLEEWRQQASADPSALYNAIHDTMNNIFTNSPGIEALRRNIDNIYQLRIHRTGSLKSAAEEALINTRVLLSIIDTCIKDHTPQPTPNGFFSPQKVAEEMIKGGHILIEDNGALCDYIIQQQNLSPRFSSHYKNNKIRAHLRDNPSLTTQMATDEFNRAKPDYSLRAETVFNEMLLGKTINDAGQTCTWLQFEGHSHQPRTVYECYLVQLLDSFIQLFNYSLEKLGHHMDFVRYSLNGKTRNIGQYGNSEYVESNPIKLSPNR